MLELLSATRFEKVMGSGRTQPCLLVCENEAGEEVEVVAKLRGHPQIMPGGLLAEAVASLLALDLDLPVQTPYRIAIERAFADTVPDAGLRAIIQKSVGLNFGCAKWAPGCTIWPRDKTPSRDMKQSLMEVFAFDGLIQNPDRRQINPNCAFLGNDLVLFDHESAFSHFMSIVPVVPWEAGGLGFLKDHIFFHALRGGNLALDRFQGALEAIGEARIAEYIQSIPAEWNGQASTGKKIQTYLTDCMVNFQGIRLQLETLL
jgi:hypothetical protein